MIIGNLNQDLHQFNYIENQDLKKVADFIKSNDFSTKTEGRHPLEGERIFYNLISYNTTFTSKRDPEAHWEYIDFQYLISGEENIGWAPYNQDQEILKAYNPENDILTFCNVKQESFFTLKAGMYAIFFPDDIHRPGIQTSRSLAVKKLVFKIKI
ncbi:MAG: YhcH/YjgK/YiaL family protein [Actinomycetota bacterium]|nr:YhcH/YjgK/YiaL family protein [Actinomycetota bacterium]